MRKSVVFSSVIFALVVFVSVTACKKGDKDPSFTLQTRAKRLVGEWKMKEAKITLTIADSSGTSASQTVKMQGESYSVDVVGKGTATGLHKLSISIAKEGKFSFSETFDTVKTVGKGAWDFLGKTGEYKNKQRVLFNMGSSGVNSYYIYVFNKTLNAFQYNLEELSKDEIIMTCTDELLNTTSNGTSLFITSAYTFKQ